MKRVRELWDIAFLRARWDYLLPIDSPIADASRNIAMKEVTRALLSQESQRQSGRGLLNVNAVPCFITHTDSDTLTDKTMSSDEVIPGTNCMSYPKGWPKSAEIRTYKGSCHCGRFRYEFEFPDIQNSKVISCNCSLCSVQGALNV